MAINTTPGQNVSQQPVDNFQLAQGLATSTAAAATVNLPLATITTESISTAAGATYSFVFTNSLIVPNSIVHAAVGKGSYTTGQPMVASISNGTGSTTIVVQNIHASAAINGTIVLTISVIN